MYSDGNPFFNIAQSHSIIRLDCGNEWLQDEDA